MYLFSLLPAELAWVLHSTMVYACLDTCCSHFLTIIAGVDVHFRHESELCICSLSPIILILVILEVNFL